jgi:hypothetical protein
VLTFVIDAETHQVTEDQLRDLVDVGVRIMKDAARASGLSFRIANLHSSAPTFVWTPTAKKATVDVDAEFDRMARRLVEGIDDLEADRGVPDWMSETTARALYGASGRFDTSGVDGLTFSHDGTHRRITRQAYRTLDRVLHEESKSLGTVTGRLVTVTLNNGAHVSVADEAFSNSVHCYVSEDELRRAGQWVGLRVVATGEVNRSYTGQPLSVRRATIDLVPTPEHVSVADATQLYRNGPSVERFLREQRGG